MAKVACGEREVIFKIQLQYLVIYVAIFKLVSLVVVACKKLIGYLLMADSTDSGKKLVHIERIELRLKKLRTENILITE